MRKHQLLKNDCTPWSNLFILLLRIKYKTAVWQILQFEMPNVGHWTALIPRNHVTKALRRQPTKLMTVACIHDRNERAAPYCTLSLSWGFRGGRRLNYATRIWT